MFNSSIINPELKSFIFPKSLNEVANHMIKYALIGVSRLLYYDELSCSIRDLLLRDKNNLSII